MFKNGYFHVFLGQSASSGAQAVFYFIFAIFLQPGEYGTLSFIIALAGIASIISRFGNNLSVIKFQAKNEKKISSSLNSIVFLFSIIASIILIPINQYASLLTFASTIFFLNTSNLIGLQNYKKFALTHLKRGILILVFPIIFYYIIGFDGILIGISIAYLISGFGFLFKLKFSKEIFLDFKRNFHELLQNFGVDVSISLVRFIDKLVIGIFVGFGFLGVYQLNIQFVFGIEILLGALYSFLLSEESSGRKHKKTTLFVIISSIGITLFLIFSAPFFIPIFFENFTDGIESLQIMLLSVIPLTFSFVLLPKLQITNSPKVGFSGIIRIISLIFLVILLGNFMGLMGLSLAVVISSSLYTLFLLILFINNKNHLKSSFI
jgi:O-antigen/teichoic acid export membrane protein